MKKYLFVFLVISSFLGLLTGCSKQENSDIVETDTKSTTLISHNDIEDLTTEPTQNIIEDSSAEPTQNIIEDSSAEPTQNTIEDSNTEPTSDAVLEETVKLTLEGVMESSVEVSDAKFDMRKLNLSGLYEGDSNVIITDDGKMIFWNTYDEEAKTYDIASVEIETDMIVYEALFDATYRITGVTNDGEEYIVCTDGRLLRDYNYNEEYGYCYNTYYADHVREFNEYIIEYMPSSVIIPTFSDEIEGIELDAELLAQVCGVYYTPAKEYEDGEAVYESAYKISEDGYIYEWDDKHAISLDGQWHKYPIVRLTVYETEDYKEINIDTRYRTYEYRHDTDTISPTLSGRYTYGFYFVECEKVDELPNNVPALK